MEKVKSKSERRITKGQENHPMQTIQNYNFNKQQAPLASQPIALNSISTSTIEMNHKSDNNKNGGKFATVGKSKGKKAVISKADISNPTNFRVVQHVGLTSQPTSMSSNNNNNQFEVYLKHF